MICGLPWVNPDVGFSLQQELLKCDDEPYAKEQLEKLSEKNPAISSFIERFADGSDDPMAVMFCGILVYRLLESQAEANKMLQEIALE